MRTVFKATYYPLTDTQPSYWIFKTMDEATKWKAWVMGMGLSVESQWTLEEIEDATYEQ